MNGVSSIKGLPAIFIQISWVVAVCLSICPDGQAQVGQPSGFQLSGTGNKAIGNKSNDTITVAAMSCPARTTCPTTSVPFTLIDFWGLKTGRVNQLYWKTKNEDSINYYQVQRSADTVKFDSIGYVATTNLSGLNRYTWTDSIPMTGKNYYRLRIVDIAGLYTYSKVILLERDENPGIHVYPNPVSGLLHIQIYSPAAGANDLLITDMAGRTMGRIQTSVSAGFTNYSMNVGNWANGKYILISRDRQNGEIHNSTFTVIH